MNKKGDILMTLTVPATLVLVIYALFSFYSFNMNLQSSSQSVSDMVEELHFSESYVNALVEFVANEGVQSGADDLKKDFQIRIATHDLQMDGVGNFFGKIRTGDFVLEERPEGVSLEVRGLFVQSTRGANSMKRVFDVKQVFEKKKIVEDMKK